MKMTKAEKDKRNKAGYIVQKALRKHILIRPAHCELCNRNPRQSRNIPIVAHHWRGYDYPLDIWWVCQSCNALLRGCHNGRLSKSEAINVMKKYMSIAKACEYVGVYRARIYYAIRIGQIKGVKHFCDLIGIPKRHSEPLMIPVKEVEKYCLLL